MLSIKPKVLYVRDPKTGKFIPLVAIRGGKGPPGSIENITDYLTSETGDSVELAMSQKGVTLLLSGIESELENLATELSKAKLELTETKAELTEANAELTETKAELIKVTNSLNFLYGNGTLGLEYFLGADSCYSVVGIGNATDTEIVIPSSICNIPVKYILPHAFQSCASFTSVTIGNGVTSIGDWALNACTELTSVTIPNSVTKIGQYAFQSCDKLTDIYYQGTEAEWEAIDIHVGNQSVIGAATIHFVSSLSEE